MTTQEIKLLKNLHKQLTYGRGLYTSQWDTLIELRTKDLLRRGENPDNYDLKSRNCQRKNLLV